MKRVVSIFCAVFMAIALPLIALAHPGHGTDDGFSITHYLKEPEHIALLVLIVAAVVFIVARVRRKTTK